MNKIYKVVWSKVKQCYVVASELAKRRTKAPKVEAFSRVLLAGVLTCILTCSVMFPVKAAIPATQISNYYDIQHHIRSIEGTDDDGNDFAHLWLATDKSTGAKTILYTYTTRESDLRFVSAEVWGTVDGGTVFTAGNGITISSDNKVYV